MQKILQHSPDTSKKQKKPHGKKQQRFNSPNMMPFFTGPLPVQCVGGRRPGMVLFADATQDCSTSEDFSPRTVLTKSITKDRCVHHILATFPDNNGLSNSLRNNLFVDGARTLNRKHMWKCATNAKKKKKRLTPGDSDTWILMMSLSRTLQVRP